MPIGRPAGRPGSHQLPPLSAVSSQPVRNKPSPHLYGSPSVAAISDRRLPRPPARHPGPYGALTPTHVCAAFGPSAAATQASSQSALSAFRKARSLCRLLPRAKRLSPATASRSTVIARSAISTSDTRRDTH
ncbi:hypothetical protein NDU88_007458 [Pleurodeles waltl]|uniref:Uncharacterized protein n=1 Tax=Pleurodeles waltl TaxID=8319 RepID=A0AAV7N701_PLEWA|nr:hypothetical protein NDU88_007458 [Pleurodeles waltl]